MRLKKNGLKVTSEHHQQPGRQATFFFFFSRTDSSPTTHPRHSHALCCLTPLSVDNFGTLRERPLARFVPSFHPMSRVVLKASLFEVLAVEIVRERQYTKEMVGKKRRISYPMVLLIAANWWTRRLTLLDSTLRSIGPNLWMYNTVWIIMLT